jgi:hypothetical protein
MDESPMNLHMQMPNAIRIMTNTVHKGSEAFLDYPFAKRDDGIFIRPRPIGAKRRKASASPIRFIWPVSGNLKYIAKTTVDSSHC